VFEAYLTAEWGDVDMNGHMGNFAFLKKAAHMRMIFFESIGFGTDVLNGIGIGAVVRKDELTYYSEIRPYESIRATISLVGLSENGSRFQLQVDLWRPDTDNQHSATVQGLGGWLNLEARKLVVPPESLVNGMLTLEKAEGFEVLKNSVN